MLYKNTSPLNTAPPPLFFLTGITLLDPPLFWAHSMHTTLLSRALHSHRCTYTGFCGSLYWSESGWRCVENMVVIWWMNVPSLFKALPFVPVYAQMHICMNFGQNANPGVSPRAIAKSLAGGSLKALSPLCIPLSSSLLQACKQLSEGSPCTVSILAIPALSLTCWMLSFAHTILPKFFYVKSP